MTPEGDYPTLDDIYEQLPEVQVVDVGTGNGQDVYFEINSGKSAIGLEPYPGKSDAHRGWPRIEELTSSEPGIAPLFLRSLDRRFIPRSSIVEVESNIVRCTFDEFLAAMPKATDNKLEKIMFSVKAGL